MYSIFVVVNVNVKPEHVVAFEEASIANGKSSVETEPGCLRFDLLKDEKDPSRFYFIEFFTEEAALHAHWETPHFGEYWSEIENMLDGKFEERVGMVSAFSMSKD